MTHLTESQRGALDRLRRQHQPTDQATLARVVELSHEALGLAWATESDPPLLEALTDLAELLDRISGRAA